MAKTKEQLLADLPTYYPTNAQGQITAGDHRDQQGDVIDSLATEVYVDDTDVANSVTDQAYADAQDDAHSVTDQAYTDAEVASLRDATLATFGLAGYGGIIANAGQAMPDITTGWHTIAVWDQAALSTPRYITQDVANDGFAFERVGVFSINVKISISHAEAQGGRIIKLRFVNFTTGDPGTAEFTYGVGRNTAATNLIIPGALFDVPADMVGDLIQIQIGGADTFSAVNSLGASFEATSVSEAQGLE